MISPSDTAQTSFSKEQVRRLFAYDPESGSLIWRQRPQGDFATERAWKVWNTRCAGAEAGCVNGRGYKQVSIGGRLHPAHRIIWLYVHGYVPLEIDHINHDRADNRIVNLRAVSRAENSRNRPRLSNNTSGVTGICWHKQAGKWHARINGGGQNINLGLFDCLEDAAAARAVAEREHDFHPNHGKK